MRSTLVALLVGIIIGIVGTFAAVEVSGGWYVYEIWPENRCRASVVTGVPEPVSGFPCTFRRPRWSLIN